MYDRGLNRIKHALVGIFSLMVAPVPIILVGLMFGISTIYRCFAMLDALIPGVAPGATTTTAP